MRFRIDLKIFIFIILFYFTKQIQIYGFIMFFAFIHELGHLLCGILLGMKPEKLEIIPFGLSVSFRIKPQEYNKKIKKGNMFEIKKIIVAIAGPLINLIMILIIYNLNLDIEKKLVLIYSNFLLFIFNLLPIYPLDGGRIIKGIFHIIFGKRNAEKYMNYISLISVIIFTAFSSILILYIENISIFLISLFLLCIVIQENKKYKKREAIYKKILESKVI